MKRIAIVLSLVLFLGCFFSPMQAKASVEKAVENAATISAPVLAGAAAAETAKSFASLVPTAVDSSTVEAGTISLPCPASWILTEEEDSSSEHVFLLYDDESLELIALITSDTKAPNVMEKNVTEFTYSLLGSLGDDSAYLLPKVTTEDGIEYIHSFLDSDEYYGEIICLENDTTFTAIFFIYPSNSEKAFASRRDLLGMLTSMKNNGGPASSGNDDPSGDPSNPSDPSASAAEDTSYSVTKGDVTASFILFDDPITSSTKYPDFYFTLVNNSKDNMVLDYTRYLTINDTVIRMYGSATFNENLLPGTGTSYSFSLRADELELFGELESLSLTVKVNGKEETFDFTECLSGQTTLSSNTYEMKNSVTEGDLTASLYNVRYENENRYLVFFLTLTNNSDKPVTLKSSEKVFSINGANYDRYLMPECPDVLQPGQSGVYVVEFDGKVTYPAVTSIDSFSMVLSVNGAPTTFSFGE